MRPQPPFLSLWGDGDDLDFVLLYIAEPALHIPITHTLEQGLVALYLCIVTLIEVPKLIVNDLYRSLISVGTFVCVEDDTVGATTAL